MDKNQQRELQRLEDALMEVEYTDLDFDDDELLDAAWPQVEDMDDSMYNTDDTDVDLDDYSEQVYSQRSGRGLSVAITMLAMVALSICIMLLLKITGVL